MASKGGKKQTAGNRDSLPKYLGVKLFDGERALPGNILVRQRGKAFKPGVGTRIGKDDTIYAVIGGIVKIATRTMINFAGKPIERRVVHVIGGGVSAQKK